MSVVAETGDTRQHIPRELKRDMAKHFALELGPLLVFFLTFMATGIVVATAAYLVSTLGVLCYTASRAEKPPILPIISAFLVLLFGGLTVTMDNADFIKMKPTVTNGFYGLVIGIGWLFGFRLLERVFGSKCKIEEEGLRKLTFRVSVYLISLAVVNELVWRSVDTNTWVWFKVFVIVGLNAAFAMSQVSTVRRHMIPHSS